MNHHSLTGRLSRVLGSNPSRWPDGFDLDHEPAVEEAARLLLERFRATDDLDVFTLLYELTQPRLLQSATRIVRRMNSSVAPEDLVAAFMARIFSDVRRRPAEPVRRFLALAHTAMRNDLYDQLRHQRRASNNLRELHAAQPAPSDPAEQILTDEQDELMHRYGRDVLEVTAHCFADLDPRDQQVLLAREVVQLPYDRVAALLGLSAEQVGMVIRRARVHLADRILARLDRFAVGTAPDADAAQRSRLASIVRTCLQQKEAPRHVPGLVQRMLAASLSHARSRLADLLYELAKSCLVVAPGFSSRTLVREEPRSSEVVAEELRHLNSRLAHGEIPSAAPAASATRTAELPQRVPAPAAALGDARACLARLAEVEGESGRQQVALALCSIHEGQPEQAETRLATLLARDDLPPVTRQNAARNLTLALLRQERHAAALASALDAADEWPDDPVRVMNVCFAAARLRDAPTFDTHAQLLCALQRSQPAERVAQWIAGPLRELAVAAGFDVTYVDDLAARHELQLQPAVEALAPAAPASAVSVKRTRRSGTARKSAHRPSSTDGLPQAAPVPSLRDPRDRSADRES